MSWPLHSDYSDAIQNPALCFDDPDLKSGIVTNDKLGLPAVASGNFASVYGVRSPSGQLWAVRCFTRLPPSGQDRHYAALTQCLSALRLPMLADFRYMDRGIRIAGKWYPVVKMDWVEGVPLNKWVERFVVNHDPDSLGRLATFWRELLKSLGSHRLAHGDLQHGNVLITRQGQFRLVDYDAMFVPTLAGQSCPELGHNHFQHPGRQAKHYDERLDHFSALVIYTSFRALAADRSLWNLHNGDNLIFREPDYRNPGGSGVFLRLRRNPQGEVRSLALALEQYCKGRLEAVPSLEQILTTLPPAPLIPTTPTPEWVKQGLPQAAPKPKPAPPTRPPAVPAPRPAPTPIPPPSAGIWVVGFCVLAASLFLYWKANDHPPAPVPVTPAPAAPAVVLAALAGLNATKDNPFVNTLGMKFVPVAGTPVLFSIWDVRVQDYETFATATGRAWAKPSFAQGSTHPAVNVSWEDAQAFCQWLTAREQQAGKLPAGVSYRLPQDWEWSVAVGLNVSRVGTPEDKHGKIGNVYPWGNGFPPPKGAGNYAASLNVDDFANTSFVGSFAANAFGLYDMGGNVWQWCEDSYSPTSPDRVLRGGAWDHSNAGDLLSSARASVTPGNRGVSIGFRVVLVGGAASAPVAAAQAKIEAEARVKDEAEAKAKASAEVARRVALAEAEFKAEHEAKAQMAAAAVAAKAKMEAETARLQAEAELEAENEAKARMAAAAAAAMEAAAKAQAAAFLASLGQPTKERPWTNSLGMKFVPVRGTEVLFSVWDTRVQDYQAYGSATRREWKKPFFQKQTLPAVNVSWDDAQAFCKWLTEKERKAGKLPAGVSYRLPQDWEWSVAVGLNEPRAGTPQDKDGKIRNVYPWGGAYPPPKGAGNYAASLKMDDFVNTSPVDRFTANAFGLCDMGGNVWQWCEDFYSTGSPRRVLRGGSWGDYNADLLLSSFRHVGPPDVRHGEFGFRVVMVGGAPR